MKNKESDPDGDASLLISFCVGIRLYVNGKNLKDITKLRTITDSNCCPLLQRLQVKQNIIKRCFNRRTSGCHKNCNWNLKKFSTSNRDKMTTLEIEENQQKQEIAQIGAKINLTSSSDKFIKTCVSSPKIVTSQSGERYAVYEVSFEVINIFKVMTSAFLESIV